MDDNHVSLIGVLDTDTVLRITDPTTVSAELRLTHTDLNGQSISITATTNDPDLAALAGTFRQGERVHINGALVQQLWVDIHGARRETITIAAQRIQAAADITLTTRRDA